MGMWVTLTTETVKKTEFEEWKNNPEQKLKLKEFYVDVYDEETNDRIDVEECTYKQFKDYIEDRQSCYSCEYEELEVENSIVLIFACYW